MSFRVLLIWPPVTRAEPGAGCLDRPDARVLVAPYGLLTIAAHLRHHGIDVDVVNLATFTWQEAVEAVRRRPADLFGISCYTFNRGPTAALAAEIKELHPGSHVMVGGPHVSALPLAWLAHYPACDTVVCGEGEATALDLAERVRDGRPVADVPGTAWRADGVPVLAPPRPFIDDLDSVGKPWEHFDYVVPVTSRGCPGQCTYCCTPKRWGRKTRFRSAANVLEEFEELVGRRGHEKLHIKDDTFTSHRKRVLAICEGIVERGLEFRWVCDTRVDCVSPEVLAAMRRAGCEKLSFGVESANPTILRNIKKHVSPAQALEATAWARDVGLTVRFYLMLGNRGETPATVRQTLEFVEKARPAEVYFSSFRLFPGTEEFDIARAEGLISAEDYFTDTTTSAFVFNRGEDSPGMVDLMNRVLARMGGSALPCAPLTTADRERVVGAHPGMVRSHTDLALRYCGEGRLGEAEQVLRAAPAALGYDSPAVMHHLACVAYGQGDATGAEACLRGALSRAPNDHGLQRTATVLAEASSARGEQRATATAQMLANLSSSDALTGGQPLLPMPLDT